MVFYHLPIDYLSVERPGLDTKISAESIKKRGDSSVDLKPICDEQVYKRILSSRTGKSVRKLFLRLIVAISTSYVDLERVLF